MSKCRFCNLETSTRKAVVHENGNFRVIIDQHPVSFGHCLIVPRRHVEMFEELDLEEASELPSVVQKVKDFSVSEIEDTYRELIEDPFSDKTGEMMSNVLEEKAEAEGFNIGVNEGKVAGQSVEHLHIHVIPRFSGDVENPEGGVRNVLEERAEYTKEQ